MQPVSNCNHYTCAAAVLSANLKIANVAGVPSTKGIGKDSTRRQTDPDWTTGQEVAFADGFPALVVTQVAFTASCAACRRSMPDRRWPSCFSAVLA